MLKILGKLMTLISKLKKNERRGLKAKKPKGFKTYNKYVEKKYVRSKLGWDKSGIHM